MADERTFNVEDRIRELGEDPETAYANAAANGMADAPAPLDIGPASPALAPNELGVAPAAENPDAALHHAKPGKFKPAAAPAPAKAPPLAPIADTGTLADTQEQMPDWAPVRPTAAPLEPPSSFGDLFHANSRIAQRDIGVAADHRLAAGYAPILRELGLPASENPAEFADLDAAGQARFGNAGSPSNLATAARQGEQVPFGNRFLADRALQESLIARAIKQKRAADPKFLPGVPDTVDGLHSYFAEQDKKGQAADEATLARSPGGITGFAAALGGSAAGTFHDPVNLLGLAIPGGEGKTILQIAARDALINGVLEFGQQPIVAKDRADLGESYGVGDAVGNVVSAAAGGAVLGTALHVGGKAAAATGIPQAIGGAVGNSSSAIADRLFAAMPEHLQQKWGAAIVNDWARRLDKGEKLEDVFSNLSNRELTTLSRTIVGDQHLSPDERAAANVLERSQEVGESSPYQPGPAGDATHENGLAAAIKDLEDRRTPEAADTSSAAEGTGAEPSPAPERPPAALSTARRPQLPYSRDEALARFKAQVGHAENSTGNIHAKNPNSSASGPAQFTDGTFRDYYRKVYGQDPGAHPSRELKDDPTVQARLLDALSADNADALEHAGEPVSVGNLYLAHFLGAHDALRVLKADASTPIERVLSEKVLEANPKLRGKSTSQVAGWAHTKMSEYSTAFSVPPRGDAGALDAAADGDEAIAAQLKADALQLDDAVIGAPTSSATASSVPPMYARAFNVDDITVDAARFQFKSGADELGVTDRLKGVKQWNPMYAGRVIVWEDKDGRAFLADGHQRHGLARRIQDATGEPVRMDAIVLREGDGVSAEDARVYAALKNIAEGTGTAVDAAKIIRDAGPHVLEHLPPRSALVRDGGALARLSDAAFGAVYNDVVPADFAAVIGHLLPDRPEAHEAMIDLLAKLDPANRGQAESIVRQGMAAGLHKEEQVDLFGSHSHVTSLMLERAKVLEKVLANLRKSKLVFNTAAKEADTLEAVGSTIAKSASEKEAQANAQALEIVSRLAFSRGAVADALNGAAAKLAAGAKLADVADEAARAIRRADLATLARETASDDASRLAVDGAGRGGDTGEEGPQPPSQSGDQEQPSLIELEHATDRFSDPDGPATKQQAESLTHDLKADVDAKTARREKIKAATAELAKAKPGELRTTEPFPDEPGYHRFRYVADDGTAVGGNYTLDGNTIEGFNIGDVNNRAELGPAQVRKIFDQLHAQHPEVEYVHAYRKSGARAGETEVWFQFTDKGVKYHGETDPRPVADHAAAFLADVKANSFPGMDELRAEIDAEDPAYLDQTDAENILSHALDNLSMKQGRLLTYGKGERAVQKELEQLLNKTNNADAALKHAEKAIESGRLEVKDHGEAPLEEPMHIGPSELIPAPERTVKASELAGGKTISPEEAAAKLEEWKAEAKRIGRESPPPPNHVILSLFDASGVFSQPYRDMGYGVVQLDIKHGHDLMEDISIIQHAIDDAKARGAHFAGVIAQPPCTTFAASGARWWDPRHNRSNFAAVRQMFGAFAAKEFRSPLEYNQMLVMVTQEFIARANPDFFVIENPVGRIEKMTGLPKPQLAFDPNNFGDPYTKRTHLWGKFNPELETANVEPTEGSKMHKLRGRDEKDDGLRSVTSEPFAYAFALANRPGTEARAAEAPMEGVLHGATSERAVAGGHAADAKAGKDRLIGTNKAGEPIYQAADGSRYRLTGDGGRDTGGDLAATQEINPLDNGPQADPAKAETDRQLTELGAAAPMRAPSDVAQHGEIGLPLMDAHDQPTFRLGEEGDEISAADLLAELDADDKAIKALKDCL